MKDVIDLVTNKPQVVDSTIAALRRTIDFQNTRGAMLRSMTKAAPTRRGVPALRLVHSRGP